MAIVVDPDNLDRDQVVLGTKSQRVSLYPVGAKTSTVASSNTATVSVGNDTLHDVNGLFTTTFKVVPGNVVVLRNGDDAAHLIVSAVTDANTLELADADGALLSFLADGSALVYSTHIASGGSIADGVTKQALYSFGKEEFRTDTYATVLVDDLIRHPFPFEAITSEQFEIGGGDSHKDWDYKTAFTRKKIRTAGWANNDAAASTKQEYAGIITLGGLDIDAQVYYQQSSAQADPTDFTFQGAVNEAILTQSSSVSDFTTYLKLFVRKKARTYAQSEIADIGVATIKTIVNRFPLTHTPDSAIVASDGNILGGAPWREVVSAVTASAGVTSATSDSVGSFVDADAPFGASAVVAGDTLFITAAQTDTGYYTIASVVNASTLKVDTAEAGAFTGAASLDYDIFSPIRYADKALNVASTLEASFSAGVSAAVAIASVAGGQFVTKGVAVGDVMAVASSTSSFEGAYSIVSVVSETNILVDSTDHPFTSVPGNDIRVYQAGMFLEYKKETVSLAGTGNVTFASATNKITRASGDWGSDGVTTGTIITFASTVSNNIAFTVASAGTTDIELVSTDASRITDEVATGASTTAADGFKRVISNVTYGFNWKALGNSAALSDIYQFIQHQMRQTDDIDWGAGVSRGDVTDLLLAFAAPTGTTANLFIDDIGADDTNNITYIDATGESRLEPFVSSLTITHNTNLQSDASAKVWVFFTNDDAGDNTGRDFGTSTAIIVQDSVGADMAYNVAAAGSKAFTFDYDGNTQRGGASAGEDAPVTIIGIGLETAQYVTTTGTITRAKGLTFSLVSPLERNYSNPT
jgi:hypothetical protein